MPRRDKRSNLQSCNQYSDLLVTNNLKRGDNSSNLLSYNQHSNLITNIQNSKLDFNTCKYHNRSNLDHYNSNNFCSRSSKYPGFRRLH